MAILFTNNASSTLAVGISASDLSIQLADSTAFPSPTGGDVCYVTLEDDTGDTEIVEIEANNGSTTLTVSAGGRGVDGSGAKAFSANVTRVELRLVKTVTDEWLQKSGGTLTGNLDMNGNDVVDAVLSGTSTQITAGEIVNVPLRGLTTATGNQILVPTDGTSRATAGGDNILVNTDDLIPLLDTAGVISLSSATVGVEIPGGAYLHLIDGGSLVINDADSSHNLTISHDGTNPQLTTTSSADIVFNQGLSVGDNVISSAEVKDMSITSQALGNQSGAVSVDYSAGSHVTMTLTGNVTSLTITNPPASGTVGVVRLKIIQGTSAYTWSWTGYYFPDDGGGSAYIPELGPSSGDITYVDLWTHDGGTTWYGQWNNLYIAAT